MWNGRHLIQLSPAHSGVAKAVVEGPPSSEGMWLRASTAYPHFDTVQPSSRSAAAWQEAQACLLSQGRREDHPEANWSGQK